MILGLERARPVSPAGPVGEQLPRESWKRAVHSGVRVADGHRPQRVAVVAAANRQDPGAPDEPLGQLVLHGHCLVNGKKVDIPSYRVTERDIVEVRPKSFEMTPFVVARAEAGERQVPAWLEAIPDKMRVLVHSMPARAQIDTQVSEQLIVEFYSK